MQEIAPCYPDLMNRSNKAFWYRKGSVVKTHMILLAHLERMSSSIPRALTNDYHFVMGKAPLLLEEIVSSGRDSRTWL